MSPPQLVPDVLPVRGSAFLYPGFRPAQGLWPELPSSFRKTGSRPCASGRFTPSEVPVSPAAAPPGLPRSALPLVKVRCPSECCMRPDCEVHQFPAPAMVSAFLPVPCGISPTAVRRKLASTVSSSRELFASSRVLRPATCPSYPEKPCGLPEAEKRLPWGSLPSSRHQPAASTPARDPTPELTFRPRRFARPRRFTPPPALRVCFTPLPRPGFALQGFIPLRGAVPGFPGRLPSCR